MKSPGSTVSFTSNRELFYGNYGLGFCVSVSFIHVMSCVLFGGGPCIRLVTDKGGPPIVLILLNLFHKKFLHYRALANDNGDKTAKEKLHKDKLMSNKTFLTKITKWTYFFMPLLFVFDLCGVVILILEIYCH